jgi:hypothetical protein
MIFGVVGQSWAVATAVVTALDRAVEITSMRFGAVGQFWEEETAGDLAADSEVEMAGDPGAVETTSTSCVAGGWFSRAEPPRPHPCL